MQPEALNDATLMALWERFHGKHALEKALALIAAGCPDLSGNDPALLSIGCRDYLLLRMREATFGPRLNGVGRCPACALDVEFSLNVSDLYAKQTDGLVPQIWHLDLAGTRIEGRLPNSLDLAAVAGCDDLQVARQQLARRCLDAKDVDDGTLSEEVITTIAKEVAKVDPLADIELALHCPACDQNWQEPLDIVDYFWAEISACVRRLFEEIHLLAREYGWGEDEILSMQRHRRQRYVEMVVQWTC